jgi:hypothetical protein
MESPIVDANEDRTRQDLRHSAFPRTADVDAVDERRTIAKTKYGQKPKAGFSQCGAANWVIGRGRDGLRRLDFQMWHPRIKDRKTFPGEVRAEPADPSASLLMTPTELLVEYRGIPHLAKNERDVGHPIFCCRYRRPVISLPTRFSESAARDDKEQPDFPC